jgi:pyruvate-formate lyase
MAYQYLDTQPMDAKGAVRSIFESIEILVKQMVPTNNLNKWVVENTLKEKCLTCYASDATAKTVMAKMFDGFALWVDSIHNYRHGQADTNPVAPPLNIAIYTLSSGTAFLRWLIELNTEQ